MQDRYFRPPNEAQSYLIRVMHGCPHNKCTFCNLFKKVRFKKIPFEEIQAVIDKDIEEFDPNFVAYIKSIYLEGGDPLVLKAENLLRVMEYAKKCFPSVDRFASYATARFTAQKKQEDLDAIGQRLMDYVKDKPAFAVKQIYKKPGVAMHSEAVAAIEKAIAMTGYSSMALPSGAGHDAQSMGPYVPTGMVFIPCRDGLSHNPAEWIEQEQAAKGCQVLLNAFLVLSGKA